MAILVRTRSRRFDTHASTLFVADLPHGRLLH
jgi:hypothetical protein